MEAKEQFSCICTSPLQTINLKTLNFVNFFKKYLILNIKNISGKGDIYEHNFNAVIEFK